MAAPDDWIGRKVLAGLNTSGAPTYEGTLEAIDQRGIVLRYERGDTSGNIEAVFYPMRVVSWVHPHPASKNPAS